MKALLSKLTFIPARIRKPAGRALLRFQHYRAAARQASFYRRFRGIVHVGANLGQERQAYGIAGIDVLWIEPIPAVFERLTANIEPWKEQRALNYLVLDQDERQVCLHISNWDGAASSILQMEGCLDIWPDVTFQFDLNLTGYTLDMIFQKEGIDPERYDTVVLDTQGSELMVLKGASRVLRAAQRIQVEVADFEAYAGCPRPEDIATYLEPFGFRECSRKSIGASASGGRYWEIWYSKLNENLSYD